jgi:hypothetical protein
VTSKILKSTTEDVQSETRSEDGRSFPGARGSSYFLSYVPTMKIPKTTVENHEQRNFDPPVRYSTLLMASEIPDNRYNPPPPRAFPPLPNFSIFRGIVISAVNETQLLIGSYKEAIQLTQNRIFHQPNAIQPQDVNECKTAKSTAKYYTALLQSFPNQLMFQALCQRFLLSFHDLSQRSHQSNLRENNKSSNHAVTQRIAVTLNNLLLHSLHRHPYPPQKKSCVK